MARPSNKAIVHTGQLSDKQRDKFVEEYLYSWDVGAASLSTGIPVEIGIKLLAQVSTQRAIKAARERRATRTEIHTDEVLRRVDLLARADARELAGPIWVNCRHCHGIDHRYQFTTDELRTAQLHHEIKMRRLSEDERFPFDDLGGDGFNPWADANPYCTECGGKGKLTVYFEDSRNYSPAATLLYDGVDISKDGTVRIKVRDRNWAEQMVAGHLGIGPKRGQIPVDPAQMSDDMLDQAIQSFAVNLSQEEFHEVTKSKEVAKLKQDE